MRKITINHFRPADKDSFLTVQKKHNLMLGNGLNLLFTNVNEVTSFLAKTNKFLNARLFELNELYIETQSNYQRLWFHFNNSSELLIQERNIITNFSIVSRNMLMMVTRSSYGNGNQFVFLQMKNAIESLIQTIKILQDLQKARYNYLENNYLNTIEERCRTLNDQLSNYGFKEYDHIPGSEMGIKTKLSDNL
jgi:hypothetical protein